MRGVAWVCLLLLVVGGLTAPARADAPPKKTPWVVAACMRPHGPGIVRWTYDHAGKPVTEEPWITLIAESSAHHPIFVFNPRVGSKTHYLIPTEYGNHPCEPVPPDPKPPPPPKPASAKRPAPKEEAEDGDDGGGKHEESVEERVEQHRIRSESRPEKPRRPKNNVHGVLSKEPALPSSTGILSKEGALPPRDEVRPPRCVDEPCTLVDRGGALPEIQHRQGRPLVSVVSCKQTKEGCKGEAAGDGTGKAKPLTPLERMVRELSIASAMLNGEFNHDLARKDGKRFGIIGGSSEDGVDSAIVQAAAAIAQVASGVLVGQAETFAKKLEEACAKKAPLIIEGAEKVSKETAELLAQQYGRAIAEALEQNGAIGPYKTMREFTRGLEGDFQAHHILEKAMGRDLGITKELDNIPSVILTEAHHKKITKALDEARKRMIEEGNVLRPRTLWKMYEEVYVDHPHWLSAIKPYFGK
ncbi:hypothetical protein [Polyangium spumosum]|uniref:hypothetical protein n=1 Tax=Polyangium spumosum TaxID=889282 RepID=UPI00129B4B42|nr:hypothetical protein [Polyangium spumosum]